MMIDPGFIILGIFVGLLSGFIFYGGLWVTVNKGVASNRPGLLFFLSYLLRTAIVVILFVLTTGGSIVRIGFTLLGFVIARIIVKIYISKIKVKKITDERNRE